MSSAGTARGLGVPAVRASTGGDAGEDNDGGQPKTLEHTHTSAQLDPVTAVYAP